MAKELVALRRVKYPSGSAGREYAPGEAFSAPDKDAGVLVAVGRAKFAEATAVVEPKAAAVAQPEPVDEAVELRSEYERELGKRPYMGWDATTLRTKIAQYRRRDMRAED